DCRAQLSTKYFLRSTLLALAPGRRPLPPPTRTRSGVPLPSLEQLVHASADGGLLVDAGTDVLAVERSQHVVGVHDLGEPGAPSSLPLGRGHCSRVDRGTAHAANSYNVTVSLPCAPAQRKSRDVTKCEFVRHLARRCRICPVRPVAREN